MLRTVVTIPLALSMALAVPLAAGATQVMATRCQAGVASAPFIGAASMRAIAHAARRLPRTLVGHARVSVGSAIPPTAKRAPVPRAIAAVLPQYSAPVYRALRLGTRLAIVGGDGTLVYLMPLGGTARPRNCP